MTFTDKPQAAAARNFIEALHARARGEITEEQLRKNGDRLNETIAKHGKP